MQGKGGASPVLDVRITRKYFVEGDDGRPVAMEDSHWARIEDMNPRSSMEENEAAGRAFNATDRIFVVRRLASPPWSSLDDISAQRIVYGGIEYSIAGITDYCGPRGRYLRIVATGGR